MIPRSREAIQDYVIAAILVLLGVLSPGSIVEKGFEAHVSGIAIGIGIGWLIKSIIANSKGQK